MNEMEAARVRQAQAGDRAAFLPLVEAHWQRLVSLSRSVAGDLEAEDIVQDGLVLAWQRLGRLRDPGAFGSWLARIVLRLSLKKARQRPPSISLEQAPEPAAPADPGPGVDVARLLAALAPRQRAVMHLTVVEGMSDGEIAPLLGITPGSVRAHRHKARTRLQVLMSEGDSP
jgi:RNA polymerase sigma-70 factor (ECF subfamily)